MTAFILALCAVTLSLSTAVAGFSVILRQPRLQAQDQSRTDRTAKRWFVVRSSKGTWFLNGEPTTTQKLAQSLSSEQVPEGGVGFLPTNLRTAQEVASDLHWLQNVSSRAVTLQLEELLQ